MLNYSLKKDALAIHAKEVEKYNILQKQSTQECEKLYNTKKESIAIIKQIENLINNISNTPHEFASKIEKINIEKSKFQETEDYAKETLSTTIAAGTGAAIGVGAAVTTASIAPTVAMSVATTFGTTSTGVAISALHGAAATNAALAWLGGGALAAGGGGIAAGEALLALAGPIGWGIAAVSAGASALTVSVKNKKVSEKAINEAKDIAFGSATIRKATEKIKILNNKIATTTIKLNKLFEELENFENSDYLNLSNDTQYRFGTLVNNTFVLSELINEVV